MRINIDGQLQKGVYSKDVILYIISQLGTGGATGYFVEYAGSCMESISMEARMTICNMSIEMGARGGLMAVDDTTLNYLASGPYKGRSKEFEEASGFWKQLHSDEGAHFDLEYHFRAEDIPPMVTYGTNPGMGMAIDSGIPQNPGDASFQKSLKYMDFQEGEMLEGKSIDYVFIGSCTNSRMEDLRIVADLVKGQKVASHVRAMVVPGSKRVEARAKEEGLDVILSSAGFEFREPGCSACLGMNEDKVPASAYCVSTSNRNFQGRQGPGSRTILASPATAALAAIHGKLMDVRKENH